MAKTKQALARGYAVVAVSSRDRSREGRCFGLEADAPAVVEVISTVGCCGLGVYARLVNLIWRWWPRCGGSSQHPFVSLTLNCSLHLRIPHSSLPSWACQRAPQCMWTAPALAARSRCACRAWSSLTAWLEVGNSLLVCFRRLKRVWTAPAAPGQVQRHSRRRVRPNASACICLLESLVR